MPSNYAEDRYINTDSDSDASIVIIDEVNADDAGETNDIETEILRTSIDTDFLMDWSDTGNEQNTEEIPLYYESMNSSIDKSEDGYFYKKHVPRRYIDVVAPTKDVYTMDRYHRYSKTVSGLKMIIIRAISAHSEHVNP